MPGEDDIRLIAGRLEEIHGTLREGQVSLDRTIREVGEAIELYRGFKRRFAESAFDVTVLARDGEIWTERPFDWKALET